MGRQLNARRSAAAAALALVGGFCASSPAFAGDDAGLQALPTYDIQLCCQLCPEAANPATYASSSYLEDFRVLQQGRDGRSEEHTSELQSLMRISYAVFCLKK